MPAHSADHRVGLLHSFPHMPWFFIAIFALSLPISRPAFAQTATTTTLAVTSGSSAVTSVASGAVVTLTATVVAGSTPVTPGQVKFCDATATYCEDFHIVGTAQLTSSGTATFKFRPTVGSHSYKAVFVGTNTYATSGSQASSLSVTGLNPTTTSLAYSTVTSSPTQLTATVAGTGLLSSSPTGAVSFVNATNSNAPLGSANLTSQGIANVGLCSTSNF
jgi:Bacterial Ig-like domain (group 3)